MGVNRQLVARPVCSHCGKTAGRIDRFGEHLVWRFSERRPYMQSRPGEDRSDEEHDDYSVAGYMCIQEERSLHDPRLHDKPPTLEECIGCWHMATYGGSWVKCRRCGRQVVVTLADLRQALDGLRFTKRPSIIEGSP